MREQSIVLEDQADAAAFGRHQGLVVGDDPVPDPDLSRLGPLPTRRLARGSASRARRVDGIGARLRTIRWRVGQHVFRQGV